MSQKISNFKIYLFIVSYNQDNYVDACVSSFLKAVDGYDYEIILSDNSNTYTKENNISVLRIGNVGYIKGLNNCFNFVRNKLNFNDVVILSNPDIIFDVNFIKSIFDSYPDDEYFLLAPSIFDANGFNQNPNRLSRPSLIWRFLHTIEFSTYASFKLLRLIKSYLQPLKIISRKFFSGNSHLHSNELIKIYLPHGSCMITNAETLVKSNCLEHDVFLWGEEALISFSIRNVGGHIYYSPSIIVNHVNHTSTSTLPSKRVYEIWKKSYKVYGKCI